MINPQKQSDMETTYSVNPSSFGNNLKGKFIGVDSTLLLITFLTIGSVH